MGIVVAIGGGEIGLGETFAIDQAIVEMAGKESPNVLFIPTASGDSLPYSDAVKGVFESKLSCKYDVLKLLQDRSSETEVIEKIEAADIVYVGGGNTRMMIKEWKNRSVDVLLRKAFNAGKILSGLSAGSVCWFEKGISDSNGFENEEWEYSCVEGLGFVAGIHSPHYGHRRNEDKFIRFATKLKERILAIEDNCAIIIEEDRYRVFRSNRNAKAFTLEFRNGQMIENEIEDGGDLNSII